jgi:hypothetical protein
LLENLEDRGVGGHCDENTDPKDFLRRLRVGSERRHEDGEGQRYNKPNGIEPHGDLLLRYGWLLMWCSRTQAVSRAQERSDAGA